MSFTVRRVENPTIYVRRNKPDILGLSSAWDNIVDIKDTLNRLEDDVAIANKRPKLVKNSRSSDGKVLKEISRETQQLGKVTRFQLLEDYSDTSEISSVKKPGYSDLNKGKDGYSPTRYTAGSTIHGERPTYFETSTVQPTVLNNPPSSKETSFNNTSLNSSSTSQQFSITSSPSFHGKMVLARNEAALQKIKEKVRKQKAMLSKQDENIDSNVPGDRKLHDSTDHVAISSDPHKKTDDVKPALQLKRKVGTISDSGPTYKGFNAVSEPKQKKVEKQKLQRISKDTKDKVSLKPPSKQEKKAQKGKMTRIVASRRPQEVITTTSWRDGQAHVKRILNAKKGKPADKPRMQTEKTSEKTPGKSTKETTKVRREKVPAARNDKTKTNAMYDVDSQEELSEGRLSSDEDVLERFNAKIEKFEAEKDMSAERSDESIKPPENVSLHSDGENDSKMKDVLSKEAQSMLADLEEQDSSESEAEIQQDEKPKSIPAKKKMLKTKKPAGAQKTTEDHYSKAKTRHYDQAEVQKYMAIQLAERKKRQKQEKIQRKKQEEERQQRLKDLYERQKKSFATSKKDQRFGKTFSFGNFDVYLPVTDGDQPEHANTTHTEFVQSTSQNESDKENADIDDIPSSQDTSSTRYSDDADVTLTEDILTNETSRRIPAIQPMEQPEPSLPLDQRARRLTALQATAEALQSRLQLHALRLSGAKEGAVAQPMVRTQPQEKETGFQGVLPGVGNVRRQADENEKQSARVAAATKIQAAYRGHTVRKRHRWIDEKTPSERSGNTRPMEDHEEHCGLNEQDLEHAQSEDSADDVQFTNIRPFYTSERLNNSLQRAPLKVERKFQFDDLTTRSNFLRNDFSAPPVTHFTPPAARYEPRGDRFSVLNIFSRRHPTLPVEDILNEEPGSETASLLEVGKLSERDMAENVEYEDDFTDVEISTNSVLSDGDLKKDLSKAATYSECFESDEDSESKGSKSKERTKARRSPLDEARLERISPDDGETRTFSERNGRAEERLSSERNQRSRSSPLSAEEMLSSNEKDPDRIMPVMASTMQPETRPSPSISPSDESEPIRRRAYMRPVDRTGGTRFSPDSLQRKLTAEINLLENVEDSVRQVSDIERTRAVSLAQQETVALAQVLKAKQQNHEHEMQKLQLKAKEEAIQAAKDLEKTRQAAAIAATSAAERLAQVQTEAIKTNTEHSRKYLEEATRMTSGLLATTSNHLAEFCKNVTSTTSAAVEEMHKTKRPTTILVERGTSISEGHPIYSERSSTSEERTRTSDIQSNQSKSLESSPSVASARHAVGYSSDEFESYKSETAKHDASEVKIKNASRHSLSADSIAEDLPHKSVSEDDTTVYEDDTTVHDESGNDTQDALPGKPSKKAHDSVSSVLDYSSQFDDSSHALTDDDIDFQYLLPSREHRRKSIKRIKDISFDEKKGKEKSVRTPFESDDSFGKFTADMIQEYMHEEEVRTKHQAAILRLREKSLKEKTKAELQWLERMKKQSRDKGSDDVMPSIKKRERGIRMKLKKEKEGIKFLKAANRAATIQRRFMIYQQQEIEKLHQVTLSLRDRIQKDTSKRGSERSAHEPTPSHPTTSSLLLSKPGPKTQDSPSGSSTKSKRKTSTPSAKSVSEDISGEQGISRVSPNTSQSPFPSYSTPKTEGAQEEASPTARAPQEPETSNILKMLSIVDNGDQEQLLKIQKMLLEQQQKLAKDESKVNSVLQKVTEMLKNERNLTTSQGSLSATSASDASQSRHSKDASQSKHSKDARSGKSPSEQSIPEDISSVAKSVSEEIKESADKTANDYDNCTFESDDSTPRSRRSTPWRMRSQNGEINIDEELLSLTETSDHSDLEERIRKLNEELQREKMKAEALEKKKRKIKRSAMRKEALKLETELKNTRDDIDRTRAEIKNASTVVQVSTPTPSIKSPVKPPTFLPRQDVLISPRREKSSSRVSSGYSTPVSSSPRSARGTGHSAEVEESFIEILDEDEREEQGESPRFELPTRTLSKSSHISDVPSHEAEESIVEILDDSPASDRGVPLGNDLRSTTSCAGKTQAPSVEDQIKTGSAAVSVKDDSVDIPEEISQHSDSRSTTSIPEEVPGVVEDEESKASEIPEEASERSYTPILSDASESKGSRMVAEDHSRTSSVSEDGTFEHSYTEPKSTPSAHEKSPSAHEKSPSAREPPETKANITEDLSDEKISYKVEKLQSISEHLSGRVEEIPSVSDELSYTEPESDASSSKHSSRRYRVEEEMKKDVHQTSPATDDLRKRSDASDISKNLFSDDEVSQKSISQILSEDEESESHREVTKVSGTVSEQQSVEAKSPKTFEDQRKMSPESAGAQSQDTDEGVSHSEASSIAEEIASGYEDEDILECGSAKDLEWKGLSSGQGVTDEDGRELVDETGLNLTGLNLTGLDKSETGLDKSETGLDKSETGLDKSETGLDKSETGLDKSETGLDKSETGLDKFGLGKTERNEAEIDERERKQSEGLEKTGEREERSKSLTSESSRGLGRGYSDDFEADDASTPEEISEIIEEFSEKTDDSGAENFEIFTTNDKTSQDQETLEHPLETGYKSREEEPRDEPREPESRVSRVLDNITDEIYRDIITDSLSTMRKLKTSEHRQLPEQEDEKILTSAFSKVTKKLVDNEGPVGTHEVISEHEDITREGTDENVVPTVRLDSDTAGVVIVDRRGDTATDSEKVEHVDTDVVTDTSGQADRDTQEHTAPDMDNRGHVDTDSITKDLLAEAIMQMMAIKRRIKEKHLKLSVEDKTPPDVPPSTGEILPAKSPDATPPARTTSPVNIPETETPGAKSPVLSEKAPLAKLPVFGSPDEDRAVDHALRIAKSNQILDDDLAGLLGTPVDDEDDEDFPVNETKFSDIPSDDNEPSLPEFSPMFAVPHSTQEVTPMVNSAFDVLLEHKQSGIPLEDCVVQAQLVGETENELECSSIQSYRRLVFDLTKEVFIDTISQHEPASQPPWTKAKWKGGQKLSRNFKRWKSDEEIRAAVLERVTNVIGLGAPRATMATIPRKTPVRGNKKDNVDAILIEELRQEEPLWTDYEEDETSVKFQVADAILNMLLEDTVRVFNAIQAKKHVPDDVLVV